MNTSQDITNSELNYKQFYKELGHLLYAVAYSDGKIRKKEVEALREFVLKQLAPFEPSSDSSGMNQAFYTQFEFEDIANKNEPATVVFLSFVEYLKKNATQMDDHLKTAIVKAVEKVSQAYKKTNKLEQEMINKLKEEITAL
jgi:uncharacterized tellurite resistance protein B-like protein